MEIVEHRNPTQKPAKVVKIRVAGVGGGGCNAINNMIKRGLHGVDMIAMNTDIQALNRCLTDKLIQLGPNITGGKGAGSVPDVGKAAAEESIDEIKDALKDSDMVFITCGMGGGTGTGAAPIVAKIAKELKKDIKGDPKRENEDKALVVGIVTTPFDWEGPDRRFFADEGIKELRKHIDSLIIIPNQKLIDTTDKKIRFSEAYKKVDEILYNATAGISEIITEEGYINVDFADVCTVMRAKGDALMGIGTARGENRAIEATENALNSPLLDGISITGATKALVNITAGDEFGLHEMNEVLSTISRIAGKDINIIHGVVIREQEQEDIKVSVVATGFAPFVEMKEETNIQTTKTLPNPLGAVINPPTQRENTDTVAPTSGAGFGRVNSGRYNGNFVPSPNPIKKDNYPAKEMPQSAGTYNKAPIGNELTNFNVPSYIRNAAKYTNGNGAVNLNGFPLNHSAKNDSPEANLEEHNEMVIGSMEKTEKIPFMRRILD